MKKFIKMFLFTTFLVGFASAATAPRLIPFQGRLTDQNGAELVDEIYTITFNLYDLSVGGTLIWTERHEKVSVINGMVNVFLGSIQQFDIEFSDTRYLGITIDVDDNPNTADPEMVPRQLIIPAFWAKTADEAIKLNGFDWPDILEGNGDDPTVKKVRDTDKLDGFDWSDILVGAGNDPSTALIRGDKVDGSTFGPAGIIAPFAGPESNIPDGWFLCDGLPKSRTEYSGLFAAIGVSWGSGDGSTTFNVPDLRGRFLRGVDSGSGRDPDTTGRVDKDGIIVGGVVGSYQDDKFKEHDHAQELGSVEMIVQNGVFMAAREANDDTSRTSLEGGLETRPKNAYVNYIIKY